MNLNSLSFFKTSNENSQIQQNQSAVFSRTPGDNSVTNSGLELLKAMTQGDTFQGEVLAVKDNQVMLRLAGNATLTAVLSGDVNVEAGKTMTFTVESNKGQTISIKPMPAGAQELAMADKALETAGLSFSEKNLEIVKELVRQNMPIDKNSLTNMTRIAAKYPEADVETLVRMTKLNIPVTEENIAQFKAYRAYESSISNELSTISEGIMEALSMGTEESVEVLGQVIDDLFMYDNPKPDEELLQTLKEAVETVTDNAKAENTQEAPLMSNDLKEALTNIKEIITENTTFKELLTTLKENMLHLNDADKAELMKNKAVKQLVKSGINSNLSFPLDEGFTKETVQKYFSKTENILKNLEETLKKEPQTQQLAKNTENIRQNIDFMNDINRNMAYFQMPINFSNSQGSGELYVFADKKKIMAKSDNLSALLHLDMEHLGPVDVFVRLSGKNVSTSFSLESEEMLEFVYSRMDILTQRLEKLGYKTNVEMKITDKEKQLDFVDDFLDAGSKPMEISQYLFDVKA